LYAGTDQVILWSYRNLCKNAKCGRGGYGRGIKARKRPGGIVKQEILWKAVGEGVGTNVGIGTKFGGYYDIVLSAATLQFRGAEFNAIQLY